MELVREQVNRVPAKWVVVSGGARGVDQVAVALAKQRGLRTEVFEAQWEQFGKSAGFRRNEQLIGSVHCVVAFWDGASAGTAHAIRLAKGRGIPVRVCSAKASPEQLERGAREAQQRKESFEQRRWQQEERAYREAMLEAGRLDENEAERELQRQSWDDGFHALHDGLYRGERDKSGRWHPAEWEDPLETDDELVEGWDEYSNEQLDLIDRILSYRGPNPFLLDMQRQLKAHKKLSDNQLDTAQAQFTRAEARRRERQAWDELRSWLHAA